jgi:hypothetical protein
VQLGAGHTRARWRSREASGFVAALRTEADGLSRRRFDLVAVSGTRPYRAAHGSADVQIGLGAFRVVPAVRGGWASDHAPPDEQPALGGPRSFAGLHRGEWRGRQAVGLELCLQRHLRGALAHVAMQAGRVDDALSRADLGERFHAAGEAGIEIATPFGPLRAGIGLPEGRRARFDFSLGQGF